MIGKFRVIIEDGQNTYSFLMDKRRARWDFDIEHSLLDIGGTVDFGQAFIDGPRTPLSPSSTGSSGVEA